MLKKLIGLSITLLCFNSIAESNLLKITHESLFASKYKINFILDKITAFEVFSLENQDRIAIDFYNTNSAPISSTGLLNGYFIKTIRKFKKHDTDLRIVLELSSGAKLKKYYSNKQENLLVTLELENVNIIPASKKHEYIIVIDPGHGGKDVGAIGKTYKTLEKNLVLSYAKALAKELSKYPNYKVLMTRQDDTFIPKEKRLENSRLMKADLLISLHADYNQNPHVKGASVYTLSRSAMAEEKTHLLANKNNKTTIFKNDQVLVDNKEIADVLIDIVYKDTLNSSTKLAKFTAASLSKSINMLPKADKSSNFRILKGVDIPAILVEIGYLSNSQEEKTLNSHLYQKKFIYALSQGINNYIATLEK